MDLRFGVNFSAYFEVSSIKNKIVESRAKEIVYRISLNCSAYLVEDQTKRWAKRVHSFLTEIKFVSFYLKSTILRVHFALRFSLGSGWVLVKRNISFNELTKLFNCRFVQLIQVENVGGRGDELRLNKQIRTLKQKLLRMSIKKPEFFFSEINPSRKQESI